MMFYDAVNNSHCAVKRFPVTKTINLNSVLFTCNRFRERLHSFYPRYSFFI
jgi:hypothetical protein